MFIIQKFLCYDSLLKSKTPNFKNSQFQNLPISIRLCYSQVSFFNSQRRKRNSIKKSVKETLVEEKDELVREETSEGKQYTIACFQELSHYSAAVTEKNNDIFYKLSLAGVQAGSS